MAKLTKAGRALGEKERKFVYDLLNQTLIVGVENNQLKTDIMRKMDVEKPTGED